MAIDLKTLIEDAREKFNTMWLNWGNVGGLPQPAEIELQRTITQAFHAGEAKGRNEAVEAFGEATGVNGLPLSGEYADGWNECRKVAWEMRQKHLEAARKGTNETESV